jgi:hypothetical protein
MPDRLGDLFELFPDLPDSAPRPPVAERIRAVRSHAEAVRERVIDEISRKQQQFARNQEDWQRRMKRRPR